MESILSVKNVTKAFTNHVALDDVSLEVPRGSVYGLLGPNGAGKTTLIRIINHITAPDSGEVFFDGKPLTADLVPNIGYLPEERGLYKKMKVGDQAVFFARLKGLSKAEATRRLRSWFERFGISDWWNKKIEELSKGMAQKVQFIVTVLHEPKLLIFDEPFSGFDPINANLMKDEILRLRDNGSTIIFSTHNMSSVEEICDNITLINNGHNILTGSVEEIRRTYCHGRYAFRSRGDATGLVRALTPLADEFDIKQLPEDYFELSLKINPDKNERELIAAANEAVELRSFSPATASMNDVFIRAVGSNNAGANVEPENPLTNE